MADKEISSLPAATSITDADLFVLQQSGTAKSLTGAILSQYAHNIESASINAQGHLILTLKSGETVDAGTLPAGPGTGDMLASIYDAAQGRKQVAFKDDTDAAIAAEAAAREAKDTAQDGSIATLTSRSNSMVNPNLLDNWYFGNPVNQRGQTKYNGNYIYSIDRWRIGSNGTLTIVDGGVEFASNDNTARNLEQPISALPAGTYTLSLLYDLSAAAGTSLIFGDRTAYTGTTLAPGTKAIATVPVMVPDGATCTVYIQTDTNKIKLYAVKLELGNTQTLAHQDASGNWVLNEIPDYGEQLRRCQRYAVELNAFNQQSTPVGIGQARNTTEVCIKCAIPQMRTVPTLIATAADWLLVNGATVVQVTSVEVSDIGATYITFKGTASGLTEGAVYECYALNGAKVLLSADL